MLAKFRGYKLCYIDGGEYSYDEHPLILYFTELQDVKEQWGDDWDDIPYEHNAGTPYTEDYKKPEQGVKNGRGIYPKIDIFKIAIHSGYKYKLITPCTDKTNSPYSVKDINEGIIPWLTIEDYDNNIIHIKAGTTVKEFLDIVTGLDQLDIYLELKGEKI